MKKNSFNYYVIKHINEDKFIGIDKTSGGYPYESDSLITAMIAGYNRCKDIYDDLDKFYINKNHYEIKQITFKYLN